MNVNVLMSVVLMLPAITQMDHICVLVNKDSMAMEPIALVQT